MNKIPLRVFVLGLVWSVLLSMAPLGVVLWDWASDYDDPPNGKILWHLGLTCAAGGAVAFWRKYKAQLELPPDFQQAIDLASQVKTVTTTKTVEHQQSAPVTVTTTVQETKMSAPKEPSA